MKGSYAPYFIADRLSRIIPKRLTYFSVRGLSKIYAYFFSKDLDAIMGNLKEVLPAGTSQKELKRCARQVVVDFAGYLVDFFYSHEISEEFIAKNVEVNGLKFFDDEFKKNKGIVLASAHLGNWEMGGMVIAYLKYPIWAIVAGHKDARIDDIFLRRRLSKGLRVIPLGGYLKSCYNILNSNQMLAINADRLFGENGIEAQFFGKKVRFPRGIARISLSTGAAIVPGFFLRKGYNKYFMEIQKPLEANSEEAIVQEFAHRLEDIIRRFPSQWFIFQHYWEAPRWPV